jgi:hypothetical protein
MGQLSIILGFELKRFLRDTQGALFFVFTGAIFAWVCHEAIQLAEVQAMAEAARNGGPEKLAGLLGAMGDVIIVTALGWFVDVSPEDMGRLVEVQKLPLPILLGYLALIASTPLLTMLASLDQTSSDIGSRHLRYLLVRSRRSSLFVGKTLAVVIWVALGLALAVLALGLSLGWSGAAGDLPTGDLVGHLVKMWLIALAYALPFITLVGATGAMTGHPGGAIGVAVLFQVIVAAISAAGSLMGNDFLEAAKYGFPTALEGQLLSQDAGELGRALAFAGGHGVLYLVIGWLIFRGRDV